ncbi:type II toxin-antitoxin system VapB family antitoxin [Arthrospira platensis SPKY1]|nr:type II toxin-antitoxin system VapB family antitoxin [Arthrospira platensis SPKY1]
MSFIVATKLVKNIDNAYILRIRVCMRTTLNLDDKIFEKAAKLTGIKEKTQLLHEGLKTLIEKESCKRLAALGGTAPNIQDIPRRR